jgi:2-desacetyl-2-hydroxyethyl bacteriochlorophyllide A dehydrogenase
MSISTQAIAFPRPGEVAILDVEVPEPGPNDVLVRTAYSGVSQGTERWLLTGKHKGLDPNNAGNYPFFPGYQAAGVVERVGAAVTRVKPGDKVALEGTRLADPALRSDGAGRGSHVGHLVAAEQSVVPLLPDVDLAEAALYRMAGVARHGARLAAIGPGDVVAVIGLGLIGQMAAQAARRRGARVIATDLIGSRVEAADRWSADIAVVNAEEFRRVLHDESPDGADVAVDTTGNGSLFSLLVELIRREGRICMQGYYPEPIAVDFHPTHQKRATVVFPCAWDGPDADAEIAADLASHELVIGPLITDRVPYGDAASAYQRILDSPESSLGMVFDWRRDGKAQA